MRGRGQPFSASELSCFQRVLLTAGSGLMALYDPSRDDMVATFGETTALPALKWIRQRMLESEEGSQILTEKPRINSKVISLEHLRSLPDGTFGHHYVKFLDDNRVTPDSRLPVRYISDPELAYVMQRYREIHDFMHTCLGLSIHLVGEVTVKWVEMFQTRLPMCTLASLFGPIRLSSRQKLLFTRYYLPWAIRCGTEAEFMMSVFFENRFEQNMYSLRSELGIPSLDGIPDDNAHGISYEV